MPLMRISTPPPVYPRVGGGNAAAISMSVSPPGLSPRGRGKPGSKYSPPKLSRSIPAWAGETEIDRVSSLSLSVYPRVGGGNIP